MKSKAFAYWQGTQVALSETAGAFVVIGMGISMAVRQPMLGMVLGPVFLTSISI